MNNSSLSEIPDETLKAIQLSNIDSHTACSALTGMTGLTERLASALPDDSSSLLLDGSSSSSSDSTTSSDEEDSNVQRTPNGKHQYKKVKIGDDDDSFDSDSEDDDVESEGTHMVKHSDSDSTHIDSDHKQQEHQTPGGDDNGKPDDAKSKGDEDSKGKQEDTDSEMAFDRRTSGVSQRSSKEVEIKSNISEIMRNLQRMRTMGARSSQSNVLYD